MTHPTSWDELQRAAASALADAADAYPWSRAVMRVSALAATSEAIADVYLADGSSEYLAVPPAAITAMRDLRQQMARPGTGSWYTAVLTLTNEGGRVGVDVDFDYDRRPEWDAPPPDSAYLDDQRQVPRDPDKLPDWHPARS